MKDRGRLISEGDMAKRFTDTDKYRKPFMRSLDGPYKVLWDYLYHDCDHAGIWIVDKEICELLIGFKIEWDRVIEMFNEDEVRVVSFNGGKKWFIIPFIEFQYGELNPDNRVHKSVLDKLDKYKIRSYIKDLIRKEEVEISMGAKVDVGNDWRKNYMKKHEEEWEMKKDRLINRGVDYFEKIGRDNGLSVEKVKEMMERFIELMEMDMDIMRPLGDYYSHFRHWVPKNLDKIKNKKRVYKDDEVDKRMKEVKDGLG